MVHSFSVIEWGWDRVKNLSGREVKATGRRGSSSFVCQQSPQDHREASWGDGDNTGTHKQPRADSPTHTCTVVAYLAPYLWMCVFEAKIRKTDDLIFFLSFKCHYSAVYQWQLETPTLCSCVATKVWNPGATPKPSSWTNGGSTWLWICTRTPASKAVSSAR